MVLRDEQRHAVMLNDKYGMTYTVSSRDILASTRPWAGGKGSVQTTASGAGILIVCIRFLLDFGAGKG
jgi:hypothetical protein